MEKQEVLQRLCALCTLVGSVQFQHDIPHDCFCNVNPMAEILNDFQFSEKVIEFIEQSVQKNL